ncbi:MAG TPA: B-box zinc finger protein [Anaerolineae bacterium]|nr:B-box zinc finger protein [Anaerolineae bacterium]
MNMLEQVASKQDSSQPTTVAECPTVEPQPVIFVPAPAPDAKALSCYRHPIEPTGLRCNSCGQPICAKCAKRTPVGYRCPACIRQQQDKFYTGMAWDYLIAVVVALPLALVTIAGIGFLVFELGFISIFLTILGARLAGGFIADAVHWAVQRRRSRYLGYVVAGSLVAAAIPFLILSLLWLDMFSLLALGILVVGGVNIILARLR